MSGSGQVYDVAYVSDKDGNPVWRLWIKDEPGNASARAKIAANRTVTSDLPVHVAINMSHQKYPACPIEAGDFISWDAGHIYCLTHRYDKSGWEYDPNAPLSPP